MGLDLHTYLFVPRAAKGTREYARAEYTIRTLRLNIRPELARARRHAYLDCVGRVRHYQHDRDAKASSTRRAELRGEMLARQHPTVWREMKRQRELHADLRALFAAVPEAVGW